MEYLEHTRYLNAVIYSPVWTRLYEKLIPIIFFGWNLPIGCSRCGGHQWNKLLESCSVKYEMFVQWNMKCLYDVTSQYVSMEQRTLWNKKRMFLAICFMKLNNCVAWGNVAQLQTLLCFSLIQKEAVQQIAKYVSLMCTELTASCKLCCIKTDYIKRWLEYKLFRIKFPAKNSVGSCVYLFQEWR